ncbi:hypothetical protein PBCV1_a083R [Paramecium bursaria Chlorella virus 1]|uniref:Uncharacterized protein n=1 Tax=Paramecium bursaria Chlorella virus 1 TaxID=10506 RepID=Q89418_PBCV1|nr:hypothetical protein PBCV1_a083R [Paramecium bursaria Chlorella virus 1]AAC96451.1 hypothetical protein [Paramecium bursaria Chlorella virus 1]
MKLSIRDYSELSSSSIILISHILLKYASIFARSFVTTEQNGNLSSAASMKSSARVMRSTACNFLGASSMTPMNSYRKLRMALCLPYLLQL